MTKMKITRIHLPAVDTLAEGHLFDNIVPFEAVEYYNEGTDSYLTDYVPARAEMPAYNFTVHDGFKIVVVNGEVRYAYSGRISQDGEKIAVYKLIEGQEPFFMWVPAKSKLFFLFDERSDVEEEVLYIR